MQKDKYLTNEKIREPNVLVVDENGTNLGAMNTRAAIRLAQDKGLDLVLFVPSSKTGKLSICKIIDYGKFKYQQDVKQKEAKKNQVVIKTKEVKVRPQIGAGDLQWKANQTNQWLKDGCQIKFKVMTFGRIATKQDLIEKVYHDFLKLIEENGKVATPLKQLSPIMYEATIVKK